MKRKLLLLNSGKAFTGIDTFKSVVPNNPHISKSLIFSSFFHLHPDVEVWDHPRLKKIILRLNLKIKMNQMK